MNLISIIVPVYNGEAYLDKCLSSILKEKEVSIEVLCINDGSTDGSLGILKRYSQVDSRVKVISQPNGGLSAARNTGLSHASGEWICFVDCDDYVSEDTFKILQGVIDENKVDVVISAVRVEYEGSLETKEFDDVYFSLDKSGLCKSNDELLKILPVIACSKLYRKEIIKCHSLMFPEGCIFEDNYWFWCYFSHVENIYLISDRLYIYRRHDGSIMSRCLDREPGYSLKMLEVTRRIFDYYRNFLPNTKNNQDRLELILLRAINFSLQYAQKWEVAEVYARYVEFIRYINWEYPLSNKKIDALRLGEFTVIFDRFNEESVFRLISTSVLRILKYKVKSLPPHSKFRKIAKNVFSFLRNRRE